MFKHSPFRHKGETNHPNKNTHGNKGVIRQFPFFRSPKLKLFGGFLLAALLIFAVLAFERKYSNQFYPGVFIGGEAVGGKTYEEVAVYFKEKADTIQKDGISIDFKSYKGARNIHIPFSTTGLTTDTVIEYFILDDWEHDVRAAYQFGREGNLFSRAKNQLRLLFVRKNFNFSSSVQKEAIGTLLEDELRDFLKVSIPSSFIAMKNTVSISKEEVGESINEEELTTVLAKKLAALDVVPVVINTYLVMPTVREADLVPLLDFAKSVAKNMTVVFTYQTHTWKVTGQQFVTWLTAKQDGGASIDRAKVEDYLARTITKYIDNPPQNSRFEVRGGRLVETVAGTSGNKIDVDQLVQKIEKIVSEAAIPTPVGAQYVAIPVVSVPPSVTKETVEKYEIQDLVGETRTSFSGSTADREHNIKIGAATISGILIAPGAEFSTVAAIGRVTEKEGYVKEMVIKENKTTKEFGGGLCQIATTLFRLALSAGLPTTERQNHRFVVHYYDPPGLDATIYGPHPDFRFINDTNHYLLLQARVEGKEVVMELYGNKDHRVVTIGTPTITNKIPAPPTKYTPTPTLFVGQTKCTEAPHDGVTTDVLYTVDYGNGTIKKKNFHSVYQPWQKVCLVGTAIQQF